MLTWDSIPPARGKCTRTLKAKIADALETETFERGEVVISQGDVGEYFYLVESGEAEVIISGRGVVGQYKRGDYFGGT
jgi:cAMP-dependent protein kinase regulator